MRVKIAELVANPVNEEIYSTTDLNDLVQSLTTHGQLEPIVINKDNFIISGTK